MSKQKISCEHEIFKPGTLVSLSRRALRWTDLFEKNKINKALCKAGIGPWSYGSIMMLIDVPKAHYRTGNEQIGGLVDVRLPLLIGIETLILQITCHIPANTNDILSIILDKACAKS